MTGPVPASPDAFPLALTGRIQAIVEASVSLVPRAARLPDLVEAQLLQASVAALLRALQDLHQGVGLAEPEAPSSLWRRTWPFRNRQSAQVLREQVAEALRSHPPVLDRAQALRKAHEPLLAASQHSLHRLERTRAELDPRVQQAQELLAQLWDALRPQRPDPTDHETLRQLRTLLADVDRQRVAVQRLEGVCAGAADVLRLGRLVLTGRDEVLRLLGPAFGEAWMQWRDRVEPLTSAEGPPQDVLAGSGQAAAARAALLRQIDQARLACTRLQIDEQALAQALAQLRDQLAPFAR